MSREWIQDDCTSNLHVSLDPVNQTAVHETLNAYLILILVLVHTLEQYHSEQSKITMDTTMPLASLCFILDVTKLTLSLLKKLLMMRCKWLFDLRQLKNLSVPNGMPIIILMISST